MTERFQCKGTHYNCYETELKWKLKLLFQILGNYGMIMNLNYWQMTIPRFIQTERNKINKHCSKTKCSATSKKSQRRKDIFFLGKSQAVSKNSVLFSNQASSLQLNFKVKFISELVNFKFKCKNLPMIIKIYSIINAHGMCNYDEEFLAVWNTKKRM